MIKLGEYCEDDAKEITAYLRKAGIRSETRVILGIVQYHVYSLEGRLSELKSVAKDFGKFERCVEVLRSVLAKKPVREDFWDMFVNEYNPLRAENKEELTKVLQKGSSGIQSLAEVDLDKVNELFKNAREEELCYSAAMLILHRNKIEFGEDVGNRLDDPIVRIVVDPEDYEKDNPLIKTNTFLDLKKRIEISVDEISAAKKPELEAEFFERYPNECSTIEAIGMVIHDMMERPESGKIDRSEFSCKGMKELEENGNFKIIDFREVADDLARMLEKKGIINIKGNIIKWKH